MTEYEKKLEELRGICDWFHEHGDEIDKAEGAVIIAFENPERPFSACLSAGGRLVKLMALHIAILKCMEKNADEDEPKEGKVIALQ